MVAHLMTEVRVDHSKLKHEYICTEVPAEWPYMFTKTWQKNTNITMSLITLVFLAAGAVFYV